MLSENNAEPVFPQNGYLVYFKDPSVTNYLINNTKKYTAHSEDLSRTMVPGRQYYIRVAYVYDDPDFISNNVELILEAIKISNHVYMPRELYIQYGFNAKVAKEFKGKIRFISKINRPDGVVLSPYRLFYLRNLFNSELVFNLSRLLYRSKNIGFSRNINKGYFCARTIPYVALQLAYTLGFEQVFFIGLDLNESVGRFYDNGGALPTTLDKDYPRHIYPSFRLVAKKVVKKNFKIYNLSLHSKLPDEVIPKITFKQLGDILDRK